MIDLINPAVPAGAYDEFLVDALPKARAQRKRSALLNFDSTSERDDAPLVRCLRPGGQSGASALFDVICKLLHGFLG